MKYKKQEAHFLGKYYTLHCTIVQPGKFLYHLSNDTNHYSSFVHQLLEDIFDRCEIRDETVVIKSYNAPNQYKNK